MDQEGNKITDELFNMQNFCISRDMKWQLGIKLLAGFVMQCKKQKVFMLANIMILFRELRRFDNSWEPIISDLLSE